MQVSRFHQILLLLLAGWMLSTSAWADVLPAPSKISAHSWAWIGPYGGPSKANQGFRMNLGFVVGKQAVAVIDTGYTEAMAEAMLKQIRQITPLPVKYAINSNSQPHRFMGNEVFRRAGATLIAHTDAAPRMREQSPSFARGIASVLELPEGSIKSPSSPNRLIQKTIRLDLGGVKLEVLPMGHAHTPGSLAVKVMPDRVIYAGDVLYGDRLLALLPESNLSGWLAAYDALKPYSKYTFIPGHGRPGRLAAFEKPTYLYLSTLKTHMERMVQDGKDMQEAIRNLDQSPWAHLANFDELAGRNAHQAYTQSETSAFGF